MRAKVGGVRPAVARIWRGRTRPGVADAYARYLYEAGIRPLEATALGVQLLRDEDTFVTISWWESVEAMSRFTGGDPRQVHHLERDPEFLVVLPERVEIMAVAASSGALGARSPAPGAPHFRTPS